MVRIIILAVIGIVSFLAVFIPGYFLVVPRSPEVSQQQGMVPDMDVVNPEIPEAPGAEPVSAPAGNK
ncbi:MAG: hypothetical protein HQM12_06120 [SAR324 cluster bacterium]|nr:hypothetical protein [SAR324 cluster bacterium]